MIRINLLGVERQKPRSGFVIDQGQRITLACGLTLVLAAAGIGGWYWSLTRTSARLDADIVTAQAETARLRSVLVEVQQFESRRAQLQQRVTLIEQLRRGQSVPVQLLDHVSRSLPDMLWLTGLEEKGHDILIEGQSTTLIGVSDFVGNLGRGGLLKKPIDIVNSQVEAAAGQGAAAGANVELIKFTVRAQLADPGSPAPVVSAAPAAPGAAR